MENMSLKEI